MNHVVNEDTQKDDIVIVAHQVVIRCLMVYFNKVSRAEAVDLKVEIANHISLNRSIEVLKNCVL